MSAAENTKQEGAFIPHALMWVGSGLLLGFGIVGLWYSFGYEIDGVQVNMADHLSRLGASGLDDIGRLSAPIADFAPGMVIAGALLLVFMNAGAWKHTNGY